MKIIGMLLITFSAVFFSYERSAAQERRLRILEELFRFIERIRIDIGCYLRPISEIAADFSSDILSELGFLSDIQKNGVFEAYVRLEKRLSLNEEGKRLLQRFFSMLGRGYADDEIKLIDVTLSEFSEILGIERENTPKQKKLSFTLSCATALALIILLI